MPINEALRPGIAIHSHLAKHSQIAGMPKSMHRQTPTRKHPPRLQGHRQLGRCMGAGCSDPIPIPIPIPHRDYQLAICAELQSLKYLREQPQVASVAPHRQSKMKHPWMGEINVARALVCAYVYR